jgi:hypothetical protein
MMLLPKGRRVGRIDKSVLAIGTPARVEDETFLRSAQVRDCERCGCPGSTGKVVGCHVRAGLEGGASFKPSDDLVVFMCSGCHSEQEAAPDKVEWWFALFKLWLRRRYLRWRDGQ